MDRIAYLVLFICSHNDPIDFPLKCWLRILRLTSTLIYMFEFIGTCFCFSWLKSDQTHLFPCVYFYVLINYASILFKFCHRKSRQQCIVKMHWHQFSNRCFIIIAMLVTTTIKATWGYWWWSNILMLQKKYANDHLENEPKTSITFNYGYCSHTQIM